MKKRILSIMLALCMVLAFVPTMAFTDETGKPYIYITGTAGVGDDGPMKLVDGDINTKWCVDLNEHSGPYIIFKTNTAIKISGYSITTGNDSATYPSRNPDSWKLYGTNDYNPEGTKLTLIDEVYGDTVLQGENSVRYNFTLSKVPTTAYQYYWLQIEAAENGNIVQMSEFEVWNCDHVWITSGNIPATDDEPSYTRYKCTKCNYEEMRPDLDNALELELRDSGGGWDGAQLRILRNGEFWKSVTMESWGDSYAKQAETVYLPYSDEICYTFYWQKGKNDNEVGLSIKVPGETKFKSDYFDMKKDGDRLLRINQGDYSGVNVAIKSVPKDLSIFTEDSVQAVRDAVSAVNWDLPCGRQDEIDAMTKAISDAIDALKLNSQSAFNLTNAENDLYITATGYRWGANGEETAYTNAYHLGGTSNHHVIVESGNHEIILYELHLTYGAKTDFSPFIIRNGAAVKLTVHGENEIVNKGDNKVAGLNVEKGASLEITDWSTGSLKASAKYRGAGIGGNEGAGVGSITINGGTITASSQTGASIGGGRECTGESSVTINDGTIEVTNSYGAGIGGGRYCSNNNITVIINGGNITATNNEGAGIGGGSNMGGGNITVTINGGTIKVTNSYGAGIGGGRYCSNNNITVNINDGSVRAASDGGAGIGIGCRSNNNTEITIKGGIIEANSNGGAGIGTGKNSDNTMSSNITISGGTISAQSKEGAGIGTGKNIRNGSNSSNITITGGTISAHSEEGAGIGIGISMNAVNYGSSSFSTGTNGNAVIFASTISDKTGRDSWNGIIFDGSNDGILYGNSVAPSEDFDIGSEKTLTIEEEQNLIIPEDVTMTSEGTINNSGKIYVDGTFTGTADNTYYSLTLVNATADQNISVYNDKTYSEAGSKITLSAIPPEGYAFDKWNVSPSSVTIDADNSFTMPRTTLAITAQCKDVKAPVISGIENGKTYCAAQTVTIIEDKLESVTVNGKGVPFDGNNQFTLSPSDGEQTIVATDEAGNKAEMTVTVNNGHTDNNNDQLCDICGAKIFKHTGGGYVPPVQKPTIQDDEGVKVTLSADGKVAAITVDDGYELNDVVLNGVSLGKVTEVKNLKTGDKLVVTAAKKAAEPTEPAKEEILAALADQKLAARSKLVTMKNGKKAVRITWYNQNGEMMDFDGVEIFRSTKRNSVYGKKPIFTSVTGKYYNTAVKSGTRYYYKVRGFVIIDGQKYYTDWSLKAIRTVK